MIRNHLNCLIWNCLIQNDETNLNYFSNILNAENLLPSFSFQRASWKLIHTLKVCRYSYMWYQTFYEKVCHWCKSHLVSYYISLLCISGIRQPLLIYNPLLSPEARDGSRGAAGIVINDPVSLLDVVPTVMDWHNLTLPGNYSILRKAVSLTGTSLLSTMPSNLHHS